MPSPSKLSSLLERNESPPNAQPSIDTLISSPVPPPKDIVPQHHQDAIKSAVRTPQTASRGYAGLEEMHPSKVHQSTNRPEALGLGQRLDGISGSMTAPAVKSFASTAGKATPTKSTGSLPSHMSSPGFDFNFGRPDTELSEEARKIMAGVREQAAVIKARMQEDRNKQQHQDGQADQLYTAVGRKIAKPKGKSGRFSDVHKQQFKRMESIANHPSTWKNNIQPTATSLKRSGSKAGLDRQPSAKGLPKSVSSKSLRAVADNDRLENTAPGKRAKRHVGDDISTTRAQDTNNEKDSAPTTPSATKAAATNLPSAITTPTKASLARALSVKTSKTSMIPSLGRSNSTRTLASPAKSEGSNKYMSSLAKFGNVKSILSRHQPKFSNDPEKIAAGTHLPVPQNKPHLELHRANVDLNKELPNVPGAFPVSEERAPQIKRVGFTSSTKLSEVSIAPPSPSKIPSQNIPKPATEPAASSDSVSYPSLVSPNITHRSLKSRETPPVSVSPSKPAGTPLPSKPTEFTFTSPRTLDFSGSAPISKLKFGPSTIRQVRPSGITTPLAPFENINRPGIAHGMANKKRKHADSDDEDLENVAPASHVIAVNQKPKEDVHEEEREEGPRAKKQKMNGPSERHEPTSPQKKMNGGSRIPKFGAAAPNGKGKGRGALSLSRLNMLARPKDRR